MSRFAAIAALGALFSFAHVAVAQFEDPGLNGASTSQDECLAKGFNEYPLSDIYSQTGNTLEIDDGFGARKIKVEHVEWNLCNDVETAGGTFDATGTATPGGLGLTSITLSPREDDGTAQRNTVSIGQNSGNGDCRINNSTIGGRTSHWYPIQGLKVTFEGWLAKPNPLLVSQVDMQGHDTDVNKNTRKAALVFGFRGTQLHNATWTFPETSQLIEQPGKIEYRSMSQPNLIANYLIQDSSTTETPGFGFSNLVTNTHAWFKGVQTMYETQPVYPETPLKCERGMADEKCGAYFSFTEAVDGFVILAAEEWSSRNAIQSEVAVGSLKIPCGCKCKQTDDSLTERTVTLPTTTSGMCKRLMITDRQYVCDNDGEMWCSRKEFDRYVITSSEATNDLYPCEKTVGVKIQAEHIFGSTI